jgi:hypothetical protein
LAISLVAPDAPTRNVGCHPTQALVLSPLSAVSAGNRRLGRTEAKRLRHRSDKGPMPFSGGTGPFLVQGARARSTEGVTDGRVSVRPVKRSVLAQTILLPPLCPRATSSPGGRQWADQGGTIAVIAPIDGSGPKNGPLTCTSVSLRCVADRSGYLWSRHRRPIGWSGDRRQATDQRATS